MFPYYDLAEQAVSGKLSVGEVVKLLRVLVSQVLVSGAQRMASSFLEMLPSSRYIRSVVAWYVSRASTELRLVPLKPSGGLEAAVDEWDLSDAEFQRERRHFAAVVRAGSRERGSLLAVYCVLRPHDGAALRRVLDAVRDGLAGLARGRVWHVCLPLPPERELCEFDG